MPNTPDLKKEQKSRGKERWHWKHIERVAEKKAAVSQQCSE